VINRGFGGSEVRDSTYYANRVVVSYAPRRVFFYAGDNDLNSGGRAALVPKVKCAPYCPPTRAQEKTRPAVGPGVECRTRMVANVLLSLGGQTLRGSTARSTCGRN